MFPLAFRRASRFPAATLKTTSLVALIEILETRIAPAFAAVLPLVSLDGSNGFKLSGVSDDDKAGRSVSAAGDVNGDGFADLIIGAYRANEGGNERGAGYVVFGKAGGFDASVALSGLDGTNGFKLSGVADFDKAGKSVSAAGDVNGDGFDDLIIGAYSANEGGNERGASYVVFGKAGGFGASVALSGLNGTNGFKLAGGANFDFAGASVSAAGDVNGDGFDDLLIGALGANEGGTNPGAGYVVFGKAGGFGASVALSGLNGTNGFKLSGVADGDQAGTSVRAAGDVKGDGFADLIIGASGANEGGNERGAGYVVFGKAGGFGASVALSGLNGTNGFKLAGVSDGDQAGRSVNAAGDVNGDGFDDLIIGAFRANEGGTNRGAGYVVFGKAGGFGASVALSGLNGTNGFKLAGLADYDYIGLSVSAAGDVNGDGFDDLIIGAYGANEGDTSRGAGYVVFGKAGGFGASVALSGLNGTNGFKLAGVADFDNAGVSVSAAGDVNDDGFDDLIIGADGGNEGGTNRGAGYVVFGSSPIAISPNGKTATFTDVDGDKVTVKTTKGRFTDAMFDYRTEGLGLQFESIHLTDPLMAGANITFKAVPQNADSVFGKDGNKLVNVGTIITALDLGAVTLSGDLGRIACGDGDAAKPALKSLSVGSLGALGLATQDSVAPSLQSDLLGALAKLTVKGSLRGSANVTGADLGKVSIGGDLDGSAGGALAGLLWASGNIGAVTVKGSVIGGADFSGIIAGGKLGKVTIGAALTSANAAKAVAISALGDITATKATQAVAIAGLSVKTNVLNARVLAGFTASLGAANPDASIGKIVVGGNWAASSIAAGVADSTADGFGQNDTLIVGDTKPTIFATIASILIKGTAIGSAAAGDLFGITAQRVLKLKVGTTTHSLTSAANDILLDATNSDFRVVDFT